MHEKAQLKIFSTSFPTYPASVRTVASTITNGIFKILASVLASKVLPVPVGPINKTLLLSILIPDD